MAAPSANKFGHVSPSKAQHVYDDFATDGVSEVTILDGGSCSFGIESTVLKVYEQDGNLHMLILRRGGVSEDKLATLVSNKATLTSKKHSDFKPESESLEGPGQFLRHYAPNIDSFLWRGSDQDLYQAILLDFGGILKSKRDAVKYYADLSPDGSYTEAIGNIYDLLRWAETREDGEIVLITDFLHLQKDG